MTPPAPPDLPADAEHPASAPDPGADDPGSIPGARAAEPEPVPGHVETEPESVAESGGTEPQAIPDPAASGSNVLPAAADHESVNPPSADPPSADPPSADQPSADPPPADAVPADAVPADPPPADAVPASQAVDPASWGVPPPGPWAWSPPPPPPPAPRRRRPSRILIGALAVIAFVGGTTVAVVSAVRVSSPTTAVRGYFDALRDGDAPRALSYGAVPAANRAFLTSTALAAQGRLAAIGGVQVEPAVVSGRTARVPVTYTLTPAAAPTRPSIQTTDVALHRRGRGWALDRVATVVKVVAAGAAHRATLAGAGVPAGPVALFPGVVPLQYDTALIEQKLSSGYVTLASSGTVEVGAQLSASGRTAVEAAVRTAFLACLARPTVATSRSCPLTPTTADRAVPGSLRGSLSRARFDTAPALLAGDADGLVQTVGLFSVDGRYESLDFDNVESPDTGTVSVSFKASVYATSLGAVQWLPL